MPSKQLLLLYESWAQVDRAVAGLTLEEATMRYGGGSAIAWTVGHVTHMVDTWINVRFQGMVPHPFLDHALDEGPDWGPALA